MFIEFYGAAGEVTGSLHRLQVNGADILLDCGLFQGHRAEANRLNRQVPSFATQAECLVLSHAHLDHSGNIPSLVKRGFQGNVYCTPPTRDLCSVMLRDAAIIQEQDAKHLNRHAARQGEPQIQPIYRVEDAQRAVDHMVSLPLRRPMTIAPGVTVTFHNAGHVLGSSLVQLDLQERGRSLRLLFTGDLGREELPLLEPPDLVPDVDILLSESTYGNRQHPDYETVDERLREIVQSTIARRGRVYIPTFALERAQEVLFALDRLQRRDQLPPVPIYIDSPLAIAITEIYKLHPESLRADIRSRILERDDPFSPRGLHYISDVGESRALQGNGEPCIVIAGSGMCEGGRIVHHLRRGIEDDKNSIVIVGFMAQHTLGRRLVERRSSVRVLGLERTVKAHVHVLDGLSAHADQNDLVAFAKQVARQGNLRRTFLIHGEAPARDALGDALREQVQGAEIVKPERGERFEL